MAISGVLYLLKVAEFCRYRATLPCSTGARSNCSNNSDLRSHVSLKNNRFCHRFSFSSWGERRPLWEVVVWSLPFCAPTSTPRCQRSLSKSVISKRQGTLFVAADLHHSNGVLFVSGCMSGFVRVRTCEEIHPVFLRNSPAYKVPCRAHGLLPVPQPPIPVAGDQFNLVTRANSPLASKLGKSRRRCRAPGL